MALRRCSLPFFMFLIGKMCNTVTRYTKREAIEIVISCAEKYRDELANRTLLFICSNKHKQTSCIEVAFYNWNFMHLTGLKVNRRDAYSSKTESGDYKGELAAADFYNRCLAHKLSIDDFEFADDGTTQMKLDVLLSVLSKNLSANMIGNYSSAKPKLYTEKLAGSTKACVGFVIDRTSGKYVPNTILKDDIRNYVDDFVRVIAVYRKNMTEEKYQELTYKAKKLDWSNITYPEAYAYIPLPSS